MIKKYTPPEKQKKYTLSCIGDIYNYGGYHDYIFYNIELYNDKQRHRFTLSHEYDGHHMYSTDYYNFSTFYKKNILITQNINYSKKIIKFKLKDCNRVSDCFCLTSTLSDYIDDYFNGYSSVFNICDLVIKTNNVNNLFKKFNFKHSEFSSCMDITIKIISNHSIKHFNNCDLDASCKIMDVSIYDYNFYFY